MIVAATPLGTQLIQDLHLPILPAYREGSTLRVWCGHERTWHTHGLGNGHRSSHCTCSASPLYRLGYVLREVGPLTNEIRRSCGPVAKTYGCPTCR